MKNNSLLRFAFIVIIFCSINQTAHAQFICDCDGKPKENSFCAQDKKGKWRCLNCTQYGCGGNGLMDPLNKAVLPLTVSIGPSSTFSTISFSLPKSGKMSLNVLDITGKILATIADEVFKEGEHELSWNTKALPSGIYLLKAQSGESTGTAKLTIPN